MTEETGQLVAVTLLERRLYQPPQQLFLVSARLWNPAGVARYYLISDSLSAAAESGDYDIDVAYVYELSGRGQATAVHFAGSRGFYALLVPAGGRLELSLLPLEYWGEPAAELAMTIAIGNELSIAGQPAEAWLDIMFVSGDQVAAGAESLADQLAVVKSKSVSGEERKAVALDAAEIIHLAIPLSD